MMIIPAIDLKDGQCVRLKQGEMSRSTIFADDPLSMAKKWADMGARRLHLVDLNGAFAGQPVNIEIVKNIAENLPDLPIQIGGGIRDLKSANTYIEAGIAYLIIGTMAVNNPAFVAELCRAFPNKIIVALDAHNGLVATDGWVQKTNISAVELAKKFAQEGVNSIIYTDIARDGMMSGLNIVATEQLAKQTPIPIIASGGIANINDIIALSALSKVASSRILGAITGRAIYEGRLDFARAQQVADKLASIN